VRDAMPALASYAGAAARSVMLLALNALADARSVTLGAMAWAWRVPIAIVRDAVPALGSYALAYARSMLHGAIAWAWLIADRHRA
jgi:hypothetical protein